MWPLCKMHVFSRKIISVHEQRKVFSDLIKNHQVKLAHESNSPAKLRAVGGFLSKHRVTASSAFLFLYHLWISIVLFLLLNNSLSTT